MFPSLLRPVVPNRGVPSLLPPMTLFLRGRRASSVNVVWETGTDGMMTDAPTRGRRAPASGGTRSGTEATCACVSACPLRDLFPDTPVGNSFWRTPQVGRYFISEPISPFSGVPNPKSVVCSLAHLDTFGPAMKNGHKDPWAMAIRVDRESARRPTQRCIALWCGPLYRWASMGR